MRRLHNLVTITLLLSTYIDFRLTTAQSADQLPEVIEVPAMGRVAQLGEFYSAADESFLNQLIFSKRVPEDQNLTTTVDNPSTETKFQVVDSMTQKLTFLGVAVSLAVSLKTGGFDIEVKGAASYMKDEKQSENYVEGFLVHKTETVRDSVDLFFPGIHPYMDIGALEETTATHVVTGIYYGADVAAKFTDKNQHNGDRQEIRGMLEIAFSTAAIQVRARAEVNLTNSESTTISSYELKVSGDVPMDNIPRDAKEVIQFIKIIPDLLQEINGGKGKPIRYVLTPLHELKKAFKNQQIKAKMIAALDEAILAKILETYEQIGNTRQKLNDLQKLFDAHIRTCMTPSIKKSLDDLSNSFEATSGQFSADIRNGLVAVRNKTKEMDEIQVIINDYNSHENASAGVNLRLEHDFEDGKRKIQFYEAFLKHLKPEHYLSESAYEADLIKTEDQVFYVLFYNLTLLDADIQAWEDGTYLLFNQLKRIWSKVKVVDCDFPLQNSHCSSMRTTKIYSFISNRRVSSDVLADYNNYPRYSPFRLPAEQLVSYIRGTGGKGVRHAKTYEIGYMFDAGTNRFVEASVLKRKRAVLDQTTSPAQKIRCEILPHSNKTMFDALSISPQNRIPTLLGKGSLLGAKKIFSLAQHQTKERLNLVCSKVVKKEWIDTSSGSSDFFNSIDLLSLVDRPEASHFVQAIEYASNAIISLETKKGDGATEQLRSKLEVFKSALELTKEGGRSAFRDPGLHGITLRFYTDLHNFHSDYNKTHTLDYILEEFSKIKLHHTNPVYTLIPLSTIQTQYGLITEPRYVNATPAFPGLSLFAPHSDELEPLEYRIGEKVAQFEPYEECIPLPETNRIMELSTSFHTNLSNFKVALKEGYELYSEKGALSNYRKPLTDLENLTSEGKEALKELTKIGEAFEEKMTFYNTLKTVGGYSAQSYITNRTQFEGAKRIAMSKQAYFLLFRSNWMQRFQEAWIENVSTFFGLLGDSETKSYVVDCDILTSPPCSSAEGPVIQEYHIARMTSPDVVLRMKTESVKGNQTAEDRLEKNIDDHIHNIKTELAGLTKQITNMIHDMNTFSNSTTEKRIRLQKKMRDAPGSPPPLYSIYFQYLGKDDPKKVWKGTLWADMSTSNQTLQAIPWKRYE